VYTASAVSRVDPNRNRVTAVIPLRGSTIGTEHSGGYAEGGYAALTAGRLWVTNPAGLYEIDPSTNTARLHRLRIEPFSEFGDIFISAGNGDLWVRTSDNEVARIDPSTGTVVARYPAGGGGGGGLTVAFDALWIAEAARDRVARQDLSATR
jgi:streptogramin lyase